MSEKKPNNDDCVENEIAVADQNKSVLEISLQYDELNYGELEQSIDMPAFEFSSPISSISSNCSSPDRIVQQEIVDEDINMNDSSEFVSLEELKSQISPPSDDDECSAITLTRKSILETIYEDIYLETPPGSPSTSSSILPKRRRRVRTDLSKCDEFKENVQKN